MSTAKEIVKRCIDPDRIAREYIDKMKTAIRRYGHRIHFGDKKPDALTLFSKEYYDWVRIWDEVMEIQRVIRLSTSQLIEIQKQVDEEIAKEE